nr:immunoglobulin heavy chain junction region [Mus musculus]
CARSWDIYYYFMDYW